jgi:subtilase family serine protease
MRRQIAASLAGALLCLVAVSTATAAESRVAVGNAVRLPSGAAIVGSAVPTHRMRLTIGMAPRDPLGLKAFSQAVATPGSPQYGRFVTVRQFAERFGATDAALARVRGALRADGLTVLKTGADHLSILVSGPARAIERAFATHLARVRDARRRGAIIDTAPPTLPGAFGRDVEAVLGLDGLAAPRPAELTDHSPARRGRPAAAARIRPRSAPGAPQPCPAATRVAAQLGSGQSKVASFGYTADAIAAAYGAPALYAGGDLGQGQTVAVYEQESLNPADIAAYQACYGTHATVRIHNVDRPAQFDTGAGGDGEAALDTEQVISIAPRASIIVYAASQSDQDGNGALLSAIASQDAAKVVSISYGSCEAALGRAVIEYEAKLFEEMAAQGQSVFASSGDQGAESCSPPDGSDKSALAVADPASQPTVTGVGGTSLYSGSAGDPVPWNSAETLTEGIWNSGSFQQDGQAVGQATAGGLSSMWAMPRFQSSAARALGVVGPYTGSGSCGAAACREVPDVSADADPSTGVVTYAATGAGGSGGSSWSVAGGTSVSAPLWAGFAALANAQASCRGLPVGDINPALYVLAGSDYTAYFRDVDAPSAFTGDTSNDATGAHPGLYPIGPAYDLGTGLGTPLMGSLAPALCAVRAPVYAVSVASPGTMRIHVHARASIAIRATDSGRARLRYIARGLPAGLSIHPHTGRITGRPTRPGRYLVTVVATDFAANRGRTRFTLVVRAHQRSSRSPRSSIPSIRSQVCSGSAAMRKPPPSWSVMNPCTAERTARVPWTASSPSRP